MEQSGPPVVLTIFLVIRVRFVHQWPFNQKLRQIIVPQNDKRQRNCDPQVTLYVKHGQVEMVRFFNMFEESHRD